MARPGGIEGLAVVCRCSLDLLSQLIKMGLPMGALAVALETGWRAPARSTFFPSYSNGWSRGVFLSGSTQG
eukprot:3742331-Alexandrium_andersonii.AAC.1